MSTPLLRKKVLLRDDPAVSRKLCRLFLHQAVVFALIA